MNDPLFSVADQVVVVSGGSRGIGRAIAAGFAQRDATVVITGRDRSTLEKTAAEIATGRSVVPIVCDVAKATDISSGVARIIQDHGRIDTLVNCAGVNRRMPAEEFTEEDYDFVMDINLKGAFLMSTAVGKHMLERGKGNQINITSLNNDRPFTQVLPYAASKAGMGHLTRALAVEWGDRGVRVNGLAPGFILTDLTRKLWSDEKLQEWGRENTPQRRLGKPEDMVGTAIFLASDAAAFLTGQIIYVDGGFCAGRSWPFPS